MKLPTLKKSLITISCIGVLVPLVTFANKPVTPTLTGNSAVTDASVNVANNTDYATNPGAPMKGSTPLTIILNMGGNTNATVRLNPVPYPIHGTWDQQEALHQGTHGIVSHGKELLYTGTVFSSNHNPKGKIYLSLKAPGSDQYVNCTLNYNVGRAYVTGDQNVCNQYITETVNGLGCDTFNVNI